MDAPVLHLLRMAAHMVVQAAEADITQVEAVPEVLLQCPAALGATVVLVAVQGSPAPRHLRHRVERLHLT